MIITKYKTREDKLGEIRLNKHGTPMKLIEYRNSLDCDVQFQDEYGYIYRHNVYQNFLKGQIKNPYDKTVFGIGYLGDGKYVSKINGKHTKEYECWNGVIERCFMYEGKYKTYHMISTVCDEWLNFQNFAQWYCENWYPIPYGERFHIDKDIMFHGNKEYAPDKCLLVPQRINMMFMNKAKIKNDGLPNGINRTTNGNKYRASYNAKHLGTFNTLEEAFEKYAEEKEKAIKQRANEYKEIIPKNIYNLLYEYKVSMENDKNYRASSSIRIGEQR